MKKVFFIFLIFISFIPGVFASEFYASTSLLGVSASYSMPYSFDNLSVDFGPEASFRMGLTVDPLYNVYGVVNGYWGPAYALSGGNLAMRDETSGILYRNGMVSAGLGISFRLINRWSLALEAMGTLAFNNSWESMKTYDISSLEDLENLEQKAGISYGGSIAVIAKYNFHASREWFGYSLVLPLTLTVTNTGFYARLGVGLSLEIDDYLIDYAL